MRLPALIAAFLLGLTTAATANPERWSRAWPNTDFSITAISTS